jgi:hypothetical protein
MALRTHDLEPAWLDGELWGTEHDRRDVSGDEAQGPEFPPEKARERFPRRGLLLVVGVSLVQLAWLVVLAYVAYSIVR